MHDEKRPGGDTRTTKPSSSLRKLLRVLVAGGVALAGVAGTRADEKPAPPADGGAPPAKPDDQAKEQAKEKAKKAEAEKKAKAAKKKAEDAKSDDSFGVKGW